MQHECYFVQVRGPSERLALSARTMYHGTMRRPGAPYPLYQYRLGEPLEHPAFLTRNAHIAGDIFEPCCAWVVSSRVCAALEGLPSYSVVPVTWEKVFDAPYSVTEELFPDLEDSSDLFEFFEHEQSVAARLGAWHELILPRYWEFRERFAGTGKVVSAPIEWSSAVVSLELSTELLEEFSLFWNNGQFLSSVAYDRLKSFIDERFYTVTTVRVRA